MAESLPGHEYQSALMHVIGVKSRPLYRPLAFDATGRFHVLIGQGDGGHALLRLRNELPASTKSDVFYTGESLTRCDLSEQLTQQDAQRLALFPSHGAALAALDECLASCVMGTRLYIAGSESFIGSAEQIAAKYNLQSDEVQRENAGSKARRVYCIHCRHSHEDVTTNIIPCDNCSRHLIVRDHYSRRLAAFMGVMADAEAPGELPEIAEVFV